jgi:hypothetical protein
MLAHTWSDWRPFPDPREGDYLYAPFGPGVYLLRHPSTGELILFGRSGNVVSRISSLLPKPLGRGTRRNEAKRQYVLDHIDDVEYRTLACKDVKESVPVEGELARNGRYIFNT